jgi:hypothetical protein
MAKLKEVRALKSSGVEPLAPTLIKRILHNLVLKAEDRRWASEIGRLSMLGELTPRQTSAAYHVVAVGGHGSHVVLGVACFRPDQHAQGRWLAKPCHKAHRSAN